MTPTKGSINSNFFPSCYSLTMSRISKKVNQVHLYCVKLFVKGLSFIGLRSVGVLLAMPLSEPISLIKGMYQSFATKEKDLETNSKDNKSVTILIPGAIGSCGYLKGLAEAISSVTDVKVICNLGFPSDDKEKQVKDKIKTIKQQYPSNTPINIVAHSMGSFLALKTLKDADIKSVITIAMPSKKKDFDKTHESKVYNVVSEDDVIVESNVSELEDSSHVKTIKNTSHIGIVFLKEVHNIVRKILNEN